jgi:serine protease Do
VTVNLNDGRKLTAKIIGSDPATDIAVLQVPAKNLTHIPFGNSNILEIGDFVVAIGNPFSLNRSHIGSNQTVTFGIISALNRADILSEGYANFIQFDAAINVGSSGGALINMKGELIGITTAFITPLTAPLGNVGISFAIPINMAQSIMQQLITHGSVKRGFVGIIAQNLTPELAKAFNVKNTKEGVIISQINMNTPAQKANLKTGDIILEINDEKILGANQVRNTIGLLRPGEHVKFKVISSDGKIKKTEAVVEDLEEYQKIEKKNNPYFMKTIFEDITITSPTLGLIKGVLIQGTAEDTPLFEAGVLPGDIIVEVGDHQKNIFAVHNMKELFSVTEKILKEQGTVTEHILLLRIIRGPQSFFVTIKNE